MKDFKTYLLIPIFADIVQVLWKELEPWNDFLLMDD